MLLSYSNAMNEFMARIREDIAVTARRNNVELAAIRVESGEVRLELVDRERMTYILPVDATAFVHALNDLKEARTEPQQASALNHFAIRSEPHGHFPHDLYYFDYRGQSFNLGSIFGNGAAGQLVTLMLSTARQLRLAIRNNQTKTFKNPDANI